MQFQVFWSNTDIFQKGLFDPLRDLNSYSSISERGPVCDDKEAGTANPQVLQEWSLITSRQKM